MSSHSLVVGTTSSTAVTAQQSPAIGEFQELFERGLKLFKDKNPRHVARMERIRMGSTIHDLYSAVLEAKAKYDDRSEQNKARRWLTQFAKRVMLYSNIFDTFTQHHPEYVSLAWGTFKLLFVLVMNQEELVSELSKACAKIAEVLPRVELKAVTYATDEMKRLVESLINAIIKLFGRVLEWYEEGRAKHAINAFWKPYKLRFHDLCDEIDDGARRVDKLAEALMQAEIRELLLLCRTLRLEQTTMSGALVELKNIVQANNAITTPLIFSTHENVCNIQLAQMLSFVSITTLPDPESSLRYGSSLRRRRSRIRSSQGLPSGPPLSNEHQMVLWASSSGSNFLSLKGNLHSKDDTKDFTTGILELLVSLKIPVLWAVKGKAAVNLGEDRFVQILRYLVWQALLLDTAIAAAISGTFNSALFQAARTEEDWFNILQTIICRLPRIFVVIDMELLTPNSDSNISPLLVSMFYTRLQRFMVACRPTIVKVLLVSYRRHSSDTVSSLSDTVAVALGSKRRQKLPRSVGKDLFSALRARLEQTQSKAHPASVP
ncbi:hypothetical protein BDV96DRAFT_640720 [Lophiotrema nucula]|uniref:DUF7708 domain-containing protein n=1 Tax=Lophiotrema nucula TaxID=690887 RepID=A0A6A5ZQT3_9PLEO|nr:hypothetical protein BDV96DRAFT_640720 [Lophiotrema nucula]